MQRSKENHSQALSQIRIRSRSHNTIQRKELINNTHDKQGEKGENLAHSNPKPPYAHSSSSIPASELQCRLVRSHRWSVRPDQVPPLFCFFPSILWPLEGRAL